MTAALCVLDGDRQTGTDSDRQPNQTGGKVQTGADSDRQFRQADFGPDRKEVWH